jgi:spermidine/putrescine transport system ATP-binding protein
VTLRVPPDAPARDACCAGVRPEKIALVPSGQEERLNGAVNRLSGQVTVASFLGTAFQYVVATSGGGEITVVEQNRDGGESLGPGRDVVVAWHPEHTFIVDREPSGSTADAE